MRNHYTIRILGIFICIFAGIASAAGIFTTGGPGPFEHLSIRGETINIYGTGLYQHMSREVAIQGIAHDYITLFLAIPFLIYAIYLNSKGTLISQILLAGILHYFMLTYLFYMNMGMYNELFLVYIILTGLGFFAFVLSILQIEREVLKIKLQHNSSLNWIGGFLIIVAFAIMFLWLEIIITPLLDGSIIPLATEHYTTLTVQGFDLSIFLPAALLAGILLIKRNLHGFWMSGVILVFLCFLMSALVAKIVAMAFAGINVFPVIIIIPAFLLMAVICTLVYLNALKQDLQTTKYKKINP